MGYFIDRHFIASFIVVCIAVLALSLWAYNHDQKDLQRRCDQIMELAQTRSDTMNATIACGRMHDDYDTRMAISAAAASAAAAAASSAARR